METYGTLNTGMSQGQIMTGSATPVEQSGTISYSSGPSVANFGETIPSSLSKIRDIHLQQLDKGFLIQVGCQRIAISSKKKLIRLLTVYIENPSETENLYNQGKLI